MSVEQTQSKRYVQISKALSYLLRHGATKENLIIDNNGYISVKTILAHNRLKTHKCTLDELHLIVENNDKKRFHLKNIDNEELICATQGHSIKTIIPSEDVLQQITNIDYLPKNLVHGTNISNAISIFQSGSIKKLGRNHVHLSPGVTGRDAEVISGMRYSSTVHIYMKRNEELLNQLQLVKSLNNVFLTSEDIPISLFEKLTIRVSSNTDKEETLKLKEVLESMEIPYKIL